MTDLSWPAKTSLSVIVLMLIDLTGAWFVDPNHLYRMDAKATFSEEIRREAAGVIKNAEFDCLIIGTSMMANIDHNFASKTVGANCINLSILGASFFERSLVINKSIKNQPIKKIIFSLDYLGNRNKPNPAVNIQSFDFLYDDSEINDITAYVGFRWLNLTAYFNRKNISTTDFRDSLMEAVRWDEENSINNDRFGGIQNWILGPEDKVSAEEIKTIINNINQKTNEIDNLKMAELLSNQNLILKDIEKIIQDNPDINFYAILPPYSLLRHSLDANFNMEKLMLYQDKIRGIVSISSRNKNIKVFGFDNMYFVKDLSYYKDTRHYNRVVSNFITKSLIVEDNVLDSLSVEFYLNELNKNINAYDLNAFKIEMQSILLRKGFK